MFGLGKKKTPAAGMPIDEPRAPAPVEPVAEIRTMPDRFLTRAGGFSGKNGSSRRWLVIVVVTIVVLGLLGLGGWLLQRMMRQNDPLTNSNANANLNANTNVPANSNTNANTNVNTNTGREISTLIDTLLIKSELGGGYAEYDESDPVETSAAIAEVTAQRAQKIFSLEESGKSTLSATMTVWEAPSSADGKRIYDFQNTRRTSQVDAGQGEFLNRTTPTGDHSFYFQNLDGSQSEVVFVWKYLVASIQVDVFRGTSIALKDLDGWAGKLAAYFEQYDTNRPDQPNENSNANSNGNLNANGNANLNANGNLNGNVNSNLPPATPPPSTSDADDDGLTDVEETLYRTEVKKPDTDADTYPDGAEVISLYSPIAAGGALLKTSGLVKEFTSPVYGYGLLYPSSWLAQNSVADGSSVAFVSETDEFIEVLVEENPERLSPKQWYLDQAPGVDGETLKEIVVGDMLGVRSTDELTAYLGKGQLMYILHYTLANREAANFKSTFEMMLRSFSAPTTDVENQNANSSLLNSSSDPSARSDGNDSGTSQNKSTTTGGSIGISQPLLNDTTYWE